MESSAARCRASWAAAVAAVAALTLAGCGSATSPSLTGPQISCPAAQSVSSPDGGSVVVNFASPIVTGGTAPVAASCAPPSGSAFNVGTTAVTCTARDARQQTAMCSFNVGVTGPPRLTATRFDAFGDSITEGTITGCATTTTGVRMTQALERLLLRQAVDVSAAYPTKLQELLSSRYTSQLPVVINRGIGGENVTGVPPPPTGISRLPGVLAADTPQVLLLEEGINDIDPGNPATITTMVNGLRTMVGQAKSVSVRVFLATLLPERVGACRGQRAGVIVSANDQIRAMAATEGAVLVDLYAAFGGVADPTLIGEDGLHPTAAGYQTIAQNFFDAIRQTLETQTAGAGTRTFPPRPVNVR